MQRSKQACHSCRKKHIRCDGQWPCYQCQARKVECQYGGHQTRSEDAMRISTQQYVPLPSTTRTAGYSPSEASSLDSRQVFSQRPSDILLSAYIDRESAYITPKYQLLFGFANDTWKLLTESRGAQGVAWQDLDYRTLAESFIYIVVFMQASKFMMDGDKARYFAHHADTIRGLLFSPPFYSSAQVEQPSLYQPQDPLLFPVCLEMLCMLFDHHVGNGDPVSVRSVAEDSYKQLELIPPSELSQSAKYRNNQLWW
eukprot:TRINITY_DN9637_c0_g1_i1.p1 TRINITY_DN9637_c0_g1~~TRINITY_DN9637_c0_g1_i1.p1  ORF type:complete len:255 (-),score=20.72 TRINITY_DN9637_c0_g1_i1:248-1012(-)